MVEHTIAFVLDRFFENQGLPQVQPALSGRRGREIRDLLAERLAPVANRIGEEWGSGRQEPSRRIAEPWWTIAEREALRVVLEGCRRQEMPLVQKAFWPAPYSCAAVLTHDVDVVHPLVEFSTRRALAHVLHRLATVSGHRLCARGLARLGGLDMALGLRATVFLMTEYSCFSNGALSRAARRLSALGFEIGLHATPECRSRLDVLVREKTRLERLLGANVVGVRNHTLAFDPHTTWTLQCEAGFRYDSTFAWNSAVGFRSGSCLPFRPFDLATGRTLPMWELPMAYMDWTGLASGNGTGAMDRQLASLLQTVSALHGVLAVNFHNSYLNAWTHPDVVRTYTGISRRVRSSGAWMTTAQECTAWCERRSRESVEVREESGGMTVANRDGLPLLLWFPDEAAPRTSSDRLIRLGPHLGGEGAGDGAGGSSG